LKNVYSFKMILIKTHIPMEIYKQFRFSIAELCQRADRLIEVYERDRAAFAVYDYNETVIEEMTSKTTDLKSFASDDYYEGLRMVATDQKNQKRKVLEADICDLRHRVRLVCGVKSSDYGLFCFSKLNVLSDIELVKYGLHLTRVAEPRLDILSKRRVTRDSLDKMISDSDKLASAINVQAKVITNRSEKKIERTRLANELYKIMSELCDVGKVIWRGKNDAFYRDYIIYGSIKIIKQPVDKPKLELPERL